MKLDQLGGAFLLALGLLQPAGYLLNIPLVKGLGAASTASPLPIVFSDVSGLETFASDFTASVTNEKGDTLHIAMTPEIYAKLDGPYNRRNVYGAAISYGPRLPSPVWESVLEYGFCGNGPLTRRFEIPGPVKAARVHLKTKTAGRSDRWTLLAECG